MIALVMLALVQPAPNDITGETALSTWRSRSLADTQFAARRDNKYAQFELGRRYEGGYGVPLDLQMAEHWYRKASNTSNAAVYVYSGPVGSEHHGRALQVANGQPNIGLPIAAVRMKAVQRLRKELAHDQ